MNTIKQYANEIAMGVVIMIVLLSIFFALGKKEQWIKSEISGRDNAIELLEQVVSSKNETIEVYKLYININKGN